MFVQLRLKDLKGIPFQMLSPVFTLDWHVAEIPFHLACHHNLLWAYDKTELWAGQLL